MARIPAKRPRISCYCHDDRDMLGISSRLDAIRIKIPGKGASASTRDVLVELLEFYEFHNGAVECPGASNSEVKQMMVERPDACDQLHVCEEQQLRLLFQEAYTKCHKCHNAAWIIGQTTMKGHVVCADIVCASTGCNHQRRWLSSSIIGDRYNVNSRLVCQYTFEKISY